MRRIVRQEAVGPQQDCHRRHCCPQTDAFSPSARTEAQCVDGKHVPVANLPELRRRGYQSRSEPHKDLTSGRPCSHASSAHDLASREQVSEETDGRPVEVSSPSIGRRVIGAAPVPAELAKEGTARPQV